MDWNAFELTRRTAFILSRVIWNSISLSVDAACRTSTRSGGTLGSFCAFTSCSAITFSMNWSCVLCKFLKRLLRPRRCCRTRANNFLVWPGRWKLVVCIGGANNDQMKRVSLRGAVKTPVMELEFQNSNCVQAGG